MRFPMKYIPGSILALSLALTILSCDKIEEPYLRAGIVPPDTSACPVPEFPALTAPVQRVLLEDFTGHTCPNCPGAAVLAHDLLEQYNGRLVLMAVHAGYFAEPRGEPFTPDFRTAAGTELDLFFGVGLVGNPNGMINRKGYSDAHVIGPDDWAAEVAAEMAGAPIINMQVVTVYTPEERKLCTHVRSVFLDDIERHFKLAAFITEDSIVSWQKNNDPSVGPTPDIEGYLHMHMLRAGITGTWGIDLTSADTLTAQGQEIITSVPYQLSEDWRTRHCRVVVMIYDAENYKVVQVGEASVL